MTLHLNGREKALEAFGWTGRKAEWIALVCLHSGVFTRAQATGFLDRTANGAPLRPGTSCDQETGRRGDA